jgi:thioesterase domain-containing protein/acyl carrier protein
VALTFTPQVTALLDPALNPCPIGVPGDLYIGGPVLASGYVNDPAMTAAKFVADPFVEGGVMYRTGDRARFWEDGNLEFLGRQDFQVKIRGYRIELGEIETVLALHPAVAECLVMARSDAGPEKYLAAYIVPTVPGQPPTVNELRSFLREKLPDYMVPPSYVFLDRMPVTPNGKVDRKALPAPELRRDQVGCDYVAPRTPTEQAIAAIVARVLGADRVGVTDDFFELGGNSLRAVQVVHGIEEALEARLSVSALLQSPTVADLAERVDGHEAAGGESGGDGAAPVSAVVTLRAAAGGTPLFLFHPAGGDVAVYRDLLGTLPDGPVYAVPSRAAAGTEHEHGSVDAMADAYAAVMREVAPEGPYRLAGWSMGGVLAYAVASRLEAAGAAVESVTLWDAAVPSAAPAMVETAAFRLSNAFGSLAAAFLDLPDDEREAEAVKLLSLPHDRRIPETIAWAKARGAVPAEVPDEFMARQVELSRTHDRLLRNYRLPDSPVAAPLTVVWAEGSLADGKPVMDWGTGADVGVVPGTTHFTLLSALAAGPRP